MKRYLEEHSGDNIQYIWIDVSCIDVSPGAMFDKQTPAAFPHLIFGLRSLVVYGRWFTSNVLYFYRSSGRSVRGKNATACSPVCFFVFRASV